MFEEDLPAVEAWLRLPPVARWWTPDTIAEKEIAGYRTRISREARPAMIMLMVSQDGESIGWCQWSRRVDYPAEAAAMDARVGEVGIDYAIGDPAWAGCGAGTRLIAAPVALIRRQHPGAGYWRPGRRPPL